VIGAHRFGDVLDALLAREPERRVNLSFDLIVDGAGHTQTAWLSQSLETRCDVHAIAVDRAVVPGDNIAEVDPDSELHAPVISELAITPFQRTLDFNCTFDRFNSAIENSQHAIARRIDYSSSMTCNVVAEDLTILGEGTYGSDLVVTHQTRISGHISGENYL